MSRGTDRQVDRTLARARAGILEHGWIVTGVSEDGRCSDPTCPNRHHVGVADPNLYTAGLTEAGLPELLLQHVPVGIAHPLLNALARRSLEHPLPVGEVVRIADMPGLWPMLSPVPPEVRPRPCQIARALYGGDRVSVLQVSLSFPTGRVNPPNGPA